MIYIMQLIYIKEGKAQAFHQFEDIAIPLIEKYNGKLLLRLRPGKDSFVDTNMGNPYEIQLVEFRSDDDFDDFMQDDERKRFLHLKEQSIDSVVLIKGNKWP